MNVRSKNQRNQHRVEIGIWIVLLSIFLLSSIIKSVNIHSFVLEIRLYVDAYMWERMQPLIMTGAIMVCVVEMTIALLAIKKEYNRIVATGFFLMLSFFVYLTGLNLFFPTIMGSIESCGCFGELIHFTPMASFIKSVVLWILSLILMIMTFKNNEPWNIMKLLRDKYLYVCLAVSVVLPLYSLWFFNELEHTVYVCGFVALCIMIAFIIVMLLKNIKEPNKSYEKECVVKNG